MSRMTVSQMEAVLMDRIEKSKNKLKFLQQKHQLEIGLLAYKHGLQKLNMTQIDHLFCKFAQELSNDN
jgi:hypothetical protein